MIACVAGVRKGRGRELGRETRARIPLFPSPFNACHAGYGAYFSEFYGILLARPTRALTIFISIWIFDFGARKVIGTLEKGVPCPFFTNFASQLMEGQLQF